MNKEIEIILKKVRNNLIKLTLNDVSKMEPICKGQFDNQLKEETYDENNHLIILKTWVSRMTVEDGEEYDNKITVEVFIDGNLEENITYQAI